MIRSELVWQKFERAKEQFRDLEVAVRAFRDSKPYDVITERNTESGTVTYYLGSVKELPIKISHLVGEIVHTLRSTLDHLAYQLLLAANPNPSDKEKSQIGFPIYDPAKHQEDEVFRRIQTLNPSAIAAIRAIKPYKGGNDVLWQLHRLDNVSKHRTLLTVAIIHRGLDVTDVLHALTEEAWETTIPVPKDRIIVDTSLTGKAAKAGHELHVGPFAAERLNKKLEFPCEVSLGEEGIPLGEPVLETLQGMANVVDSLISHFAPLLM